ncbi:MAG: electron transfer flavoprotein subunit alpha/FixB family protein [Desulfobacterales bacterium]|nr:electron transfer flavoprotein subunit alpha/FixB family protein [Desulfobacterales bacterium]
MTQLFAYIPHKNGAADECALELLTAAAQIDATAQVTGIVVGSGTDLDAVCNEVAGSFNEIWKIDDVKFAYPNAEIIRKALIEVLPADAVFITHHNSFGMDLSPGLSILVDSPLVADVIEMEVDGNTLKTVRQELFGQVYSHVNCDISSGAIVNIRPGAFIPKENAAAGGNVVDKTVNTDVDVKRRYIETVTPDSGGVDITKADILVSVGRGIEDEDNIEMAKELAEALGAELSCSRPIVDAKWLEQARQVGTSGKTVKPKVYLAMGISGAFQHLGGIKGGFIIAINKNPKAPIFQVADVGIVGDILEFIPELTEKVQ